MRGATLILPRGTRGTREIATTRICLEAGDVTPWREDGCEAVAVLLSGSGRAGVGQDTFTISRHDIFGETATAIYIPPGEMLTLDASSAIEMVVFSVPVADGARRVPACVRDEAITRHQRGSDGFSREVHDLFVTDAHAARLMVGETFNPPGHWSSYPPHKHDGRNGEPALEEVYYYRIDPPQGFGTQVLYTADGEEHVHLVRDGDVVALPYGYHPVGSPPGYRLYYLWAMVGAERRLALHEDPAHVWMKPPA